jgi:hypothetical protein
LSGGNAAERRASRKDHEMARAKIKNCGPTRGRKRVHKIGMGSGKLLAKNNKNNGARRGR